MKLWKRALPLLAALAAAWALTACAAAQIGGAVEPPPTQQTPSAQPDTAPADEPAVDAPEEPAAGDGAAAGDGTEAAAPFSILFLDVGQADAMLVTCGDAHMLVDGGNVEDSSLIYAALTGRGIDSLDYVVCTHAHEDHVGGLPGALQAAAAGAVLAPVTEYDSRAFEDFAAATAAQGLEITVPAADETFALGDASVTVLGPRQDYDEPNDTSLVLKITYGDTSFLLTGDMEAGAEGDLLDAGCDVQADLLKVGHHGSSTSTSYRFLNEVMPQYAVIQVGADNDYGHPSEEVLSRLRDAGAAVYRTDLQGDLLATSDGTTVTVTAARNQDIQTNPTEHEGQEQTRYIGNVNSGKFHRSTCSSLPEEQNRVYFDDRAQAVAQGYTPCGVCQP